MFKIINGVLAEICLTPPVPHLILYSNFSPNFSPNLFISFEVLLRCQLIK